MVDFRVLNPTAVAYMQAAAAAAIDPSSTATAAGPGVANISPQPNPGQLSLLVRSILNPRTHGPHRLLLGTVYGHTPNLVFTGIYILMISRYRLAKSVHAKTNATCTCM